MVIWPLLVMVVKYFMYVILISFVLHFVKCY